MKNSPLRTEELAALFGVRQPVALVTGSGADRVGRVVARAFADAGYAIVLHANSSVNDAKRTCGEWNAEGIPTSVVQGAVDDEATVQDWVSTISAAHGGLHVVVNAAAVWDPTPLEKVDAKRIEQQWRVNLLGPTLLAKHAGLAMVKQPSGGVIINIGDTSLRRPYADFLPYMLSKGAIETLTHTMAVELAQRNPRVRVNCVHPGPVLLAPSVSPLARREITEQALLKREGTAEDVARAILFLAESPFVTGVCIPVDGGRHIYAGDHADTLAHPHYQRNPH